MTPTQEQIEAAAKVINQVNEDGMPPGAHELQIAKAALTAAAGVGETSRDYMQGYVDGGRETKEATIERCAQWLEGKSFALLAAAMRRALKDKT